MAKAKRASARGKRTSVRKRVRAKPKAKPHANSRTKPLPRSLARPHGNRLVFSPELLADGKRRYETTEETLDSIALDFSSNRSTLKNVAKREGWKRYVPAPRGLPPAAKLLANVEELEQAVLDDRHPEVLATDLGFTRDRKTSLPKSAIADLGGEPRRMAGTTGAVALRGAQARAPQGDGESAPEDVAVTADRLHRALLVELSTVEALRARMKTEPQSPLDAERTARTLSSLTATLQKLQRLHAATPGSNDHDSCYADMPADLDEFRNELARRIRAFVASRAGTRDADGNSGPAAMDQVR